MFGISCWGISSNFLLVKLKVKRYPLQLMNIHLAANWYSNILSLYFSTLQCIVIGQCKFMKSIVDHKTYQWTSYHSCWRYCTSDWWRWWWTGSCERILRQKIDLRPLVMDTCCWQIPTWSSLCFVSWSMRSWYSVHLRPSNCLISCSMRNIIRIYCFMMSIVLVICFTDLAALYDTSHCCIHLETSTSWSRL